MKLNPSIDSLHVLVTRPAGLADYLCNEIETLGGKATHFPVIEIKSPDNKDSLQSAINTIDTYDIAIFISPTAVKQTAKHIPLSALKLTIGAIGESTSAVLEKQGLDIQLKPEKYNSESLLLHPLLQSTTVDNKRIIIFKGEGGRELLASTLTSRGADVFNANIYKRCKPTSYTPLPVSTLHNIDVVLVSSGEGLHNLIGMVEDTDTLLALKIIVPGKRCAAIANEAGFKSIITTANATNQSFLDTLCSLDKTTL